MQIIKFLTIAVFLATSSCQATIVIPTSRPDKVTSKCVENLVNIVTSCYKDRINAVGLAGNLPDGLIKTLSVQHLIPTTLMHDTGQFTINSTSVPFAPMEFQYKLQLFIVGASSWEQLRDTIQFGIKNSIWWNHMASFIIIDHSLRCYNIPQYLMISWELDLLNVNVMCHDSRIDRSVIFTCNPFTSQAPVSWKRIGVFPGINNHPFTIFGRRVQENDTICVDLDFVKTRDLGGYQIIVNGKQKDLEYTNKKFVRTSQIWASHKKILYTIYNVLNATPKFTGNSYGSKRFGDMGMRVTLATGSEALSYPYQRKGVIIVSKFAGHKSQLEKIMSVIDVPSRIGMGIVYLVTLIFFKFFVHQALVPAILNLVRMTCDTGFANLRDNTASRLYLTGLLFFVVTMQGIYQGNLASLLTNAVPYKNINSLKDLTQRDSMIYGDEILAFLIKDFGLQERFITINNPFECVQHVVNDLSSVCLTFAGGVTLDLAQHYDLHLSNEFIMQMPVGCRIKRSWYLEEKLNLILGTMMEADIFETWDAKCSPFKLSDFEFDKEVLKNTDYKVIELNELLFAFVILGIGLAFATVTFIVEVAIY